jgi:hypothetical protein
MPDSEDENEQDVIVDFINNSIPANANPHGIVTSEFLAVRRAGILSQPLYPFQDSGGILFGNVPEVFSDAGGEFDSI